MTSSSPTSALVAPAARRARNGVSPIRVAPSASAAMPETSTSTGAPCRVGGAEGGGAGRLDRDDLGSVSVPRGGATAESAAAAGQEHRIEVGSLPIELAGTRARARHHHVVVVCVDRGRVVDVEVSAAGVERVAVHVADLVHDRPVPAESGDLRRRGRGRHEDVRVVPEPLSGPGDRRAVVATGGRHQAAGCDGSGGDEVGGSTRLERPAVLQVLELQHERGVQADLAAGHLDRRRPSHEWCQDLGGAIDVVGSDRGPHVGAHVGFGPAAAHARHCGSGEDKAPVATCMFVDGRRIPVVALGAEQLRAGVPADGRMQR